MMMNRLFRAVVIAAGVSATTGGVAARPPNILVIFTDDLGWADLGAHGVDPDIRTPHMDKLARDGVMFTRGYVTAPQCVPSRAGLLAGRHQNRFGLDDNLKGPLSLDVRTVPERLKTAGYVTGMSGKWHLDLTGPKGAERIQRADPAYMPHAHGFDEYWRGEMHHFIASHDLKGNPLPDAPRRVEDKRFRIVVQTEAALSFLDRRAPEPDRPWFLYLAWFAPHVPMESPEPWFSRTPGHLPLLRRQAMAMIAAMDDGVAQLREKIRAMGQEENTLIFYISDNGAPLRESAWDGSMNHPMIGEKGMLTDGGVRVPYIAAWPGTIPKGVVFDHPVSSLDVGATAVALAGLPRDDEIEGVDLMPYMLGEKSGSPHDRLYWRWRSQAAILEMPWKFVRLGADHRYLFDMTAPGGETNNLIHASPDIARRLEAELQRWADSLPTPGLPVEINDQDRLFFSTHVDPSLPYPNPSQSASQARGRPETGREWICRNGTMVRRDGALIVKPSPGGAAPVFLTVMNLDLEGPVSVALEARSSSGGEGRVAWRKQGQKDFVADQFAAFLWPAGGGWKTVSFNLPVDGRVIHLRLQPPPGAGGVEIRSVEIRGEKGAPERWHFDR